MVTGVCYKGLDGEDYIAKSHLTVSLALFFEACLASVFGLRVRVVMLGWMARTYWIVLSDAQVYHTCIPRFPHLPRACV